MCADICIHDPDCETPNPHAHIMLTMRPIERGGKWGAKSRTENGVKVPSVDWNEHTKAEDWRKAWAAYCNTALRINGHDAVIDHRSYERQGTEQIPTIHMGVAATQMERKGIRTERGDINREIEFTNKQIRQLRARINKLKDWVKSETENPTPPPLADIISGILSGGGSKSRYAKIVDLQTAAKVLNFLTSNHISTLPELREKASDFYGRQNEIGGKLNRLDRRMKTLDEHIKQTEIRREHHRDYKLYQQEKPKNKPQFFEQFRKELTLYKAAERYLKGVLNGRTSIPIKDWKAEREKLTAEKQNLRREYERLKNEVREVEIIRKTAEQIARATEPQQQRTRTWEMEI
jgi:peptidoglycan hydrolase CwlO-like protein